MCYCGPMHYAVQFPAHRLGGWLELCVIGVMHYQKYVLRRVQLYAVGTVETY